MAKAILRSYTHEFRDEAVTTLLVRSLLLEEASQSIAVHKGTPTNWVAASVAAPGSNTDTH